MDKKYGIKAISLNEYFPSFLADCQNHLVEWYEADKDICGRVQTFLILIAKIKFKTFKCYCCVYPHNTSAEYTVLIDIDAGSLYVLLTTIRDRDFHPRDGRRINTLETELLLLDAPTDDLLRIRQETICSLHPDGPYHR